MCAPFYNCPVIPEDNRKYDIKCNHCGNSWMRCDRPTCTCGNAVEVGIKHDSDKPRMELIDPYAIEQLALVLGFGAKKYGEWNWSKGLSYSRLIGAALRHLFAFAAGQDKDDESGLPHLSHCFCCLMMLVAMTKRHPNLDDRNKGLDNE